MNAGEFRRVLRDDGRLLVAIPAPDDLFELRGKGRDRVARTVGTFAHNFTLLDRQRVATVADLAAAAVHDVLLSIYRPMRRRPVEAMRVTFSLDLLLFRAAWPVSPDGCSQFDGAFVSEKDSVAGTALFQAAADALHLDGEPAITQA